MTRRGQRQNGAALIVALWTVLILSLLIGVVGIARDYTERLRAAIERERVIPPEAIEDLIMGRKGVYDFPERKKP